jgi:lipopolysaccharide export system permease protein
MFDYVKRTVGPVDDEIERAEKRVARFDFELEDLTPTIYVAETLNYGELLDFIDRERKRGNANINTYLVVLYKKYSIPVSAFILRLLPWRFHL